MIRPAVLMTALLLAAPAAVAHDDDVNIITPPRAVDHAKPAENPVVVVVKQKTVVHVVVNTGWRRKPWRKWTGFQDQYSGPRYPF